MVWSNLFNYIRKRKELPFFVKLTALKLLAKSVLIFYDYKGLGGLHSQPLRFPRCGTVPSCPDTCPVTLPNS